MSNPSRRETKHRSESQPHPALSVLHHEKSSPRASRPRPREQRTCLRRCNHRYRPRFSSPSHWTQSHHYPPSASRRPRRCHHHRPARCPPPHCLRRCWTHSPSQASPWPPQQCVGEVLDSLIFKSLLFSNDYALFKYNTYALTCIESFIQQYDLICNLMRMILTNGNSFRCSSSFTLCAQPPSSTLCVVPVAL